MPGLDKTISINRLTEKLDEGRMAESSEMLEYFDLSMMLEACLKYMPEHEYRKMMEDLSVARDVVTEQYPVFEEGLPGMGALKALVGKGADQKLKDDECREIGAIIASMQGPAKRYYVGMMNFLGASCRIYGTMLNSYLMLKQKIARKGGKLENVKELRKVPSFVYDRFGYPMTRAERDAKKKEGLAELEQEKQRAQEEPAQGFAQEEAQAAQQPEAEAPQQPEAKTEEPAPKTKKAEVKDMSKTVKGTGTSQPMEKEEEEKKPAIKKHVAEFEETKEKEPAPKKQRNQSVTLSPIKIVKTKEEAKELPKKLGKGKINFLDLQPEE